MPECPPKRNWILAVCLLLALLVFWGWRERAFRELAPSNPAFQGQAMGTIYNVKMAQSRLNRQDLARLRREIENELQALERRMSVFAPDSEISVFNRAAPGEPVVASQEFADLVGRALEICELTDGAFDPTVGPLIDLWGFGKAGDRMEPPAEQEIRAVLERTGWRKLEVADTDALVKSVSGLELNLGAIAKGYAVDKIAEALRQAGCENFMVEIGGEVYAAGINSAGLPWRIGIDTPALNAAPGKNLRGVASISGDAVATSGDYRNFFQNASGRLYSHIIDPRTGFPVRMPPASVTVVAEDCLTADALATALFVLGEQEGLRLAEELNGVEALFIISDYGRIFRETASSGFYKATGYRQFVDSKPPRQPNPYN